VKRPLKLELDSNPDAWVFQGTTAGELNATVCADYGFVMLSMAKHDAERLYGIQREANG
jgi:hypothetical protein